LSSLTISFRLLALNVLVVALAVCDACGEKSSEGYLAGHYGELVNQTVPVDASNVVRIAVKRTEWSDSASWEFETKDSVPQYTARLTEKLRGDFKVVKSANDSLAFAKNLNGDTESVVVHLNTSGSSLRIEVSVTPD
jgi:hypothetical protein